MKIKEAVSKLIGEPSALLTGVSGGSVGSVGVKVASLAASLGVSVILARVLGAREYGIYSWVFALVSFLAVPSQKGVTQLLVREVSAYQLRGEWQLFRGILFRSSQMILVMLAVVVGVGAIGLALFGHHLQVVEVRTFAWALVLLPLMAAGALCGAALQGLQRVVLGQLPELLLRPAFLILFVGSGALLVQLNAPRAMAFHVVAAAVAFVIGAYVLLRALPEEVGSAEARFDTKKWLASVLPLSLIAGMQVINNQADMVLLGFFVESEQVGFYRVAVKGATMVALTLSAVNVVIAPRISRLYSGGNSEELQRLLTGTAKAVLLTALPVAAVLIIFGEWLLSFIFGASFTAAHSPLILLCVGQLFNVGAGSVGLLLNMTGYENDTAFGVSVAAGLNVVLNLLLIPRFGMDGAAVATTSTLLVWNVILCHRAYKRLGLVTTAVRWSK